jgi:putative ABC transport system substrate-binding protein
MAIRIARRQFISALGGGMVTWPLAAQAQQPAMPAVGWLGSGTLGAFVDEVAALRKGMSETGFVEGRNVTIEFRWAEGRYDRLPTLAADLVRRPVNVILASGGTLPARAAKMATSTIPIVFTTILDPVAPGLVASLNRPGGNLTGVSFLIGELMAKQFGLLHDLIPAATTFALLINPDNSDVSNLVLKTAQTAAGALQVELRVLNAKTEREIDDAFASFDRQRADAILISPDPFLGGRIDQIVSRAAQHALPVISGLREFAAAGALMSYGARQTDAYHQAGIYIGRILKGEKPADLPVVQASKIEFVINIKTAKVLGIAIPPNMLTLADEVIE